MTLKDIKPLIIAKNCKLESGLSLMDFMNVFNGKWKVPIIVSMLHDSMRYKDIRQQIPDITPRMLSKELKELEVNGIVIRTVYDSFPVKIVYSLSDSGKDMEGILLKIVEWGTNHRKRSLL